MKEKSYAEIMGDKHEVPPELLEEHRRKADDLAAVCGLLPATDPDRFVDELRKAGL